MEVHRLSMHESSPMDQVETVLRGSQVLLADDNPANLGSLFDLLSHEGVDVSVANDGDTVLELVHTFEPDLILLDVEMPPGMNGFDVCQYLKADPRTCAIPIIFMTALDDRHSRLRGFGVGAADFVSKPFDEAELLARMRTHIRLRNMSRALAEKNARLEEQIQMREEAEVALNVRSAQLELRSREVIAANEELSRRTRELVCLNEQLERELALRARNELTNAALQEEIIAVQQQRLDELSVPLIPVTDELLVMPLIGTVDVRRAERILDIALRDAQQRAAVFVIVDMTGVSEPGAHLPDMIARLTRGLRLLGTHTILTGLRAEAARIWASGGVMLGDVVTRANLQDGIAHALRMQFNRNVRTATQRTALDRARTGDVK